jgi:hypothetical protein
LLHFVLFCSQDVVPLQESVRQSHHLKLAKWGKNSDYADGFFFIMGGSYADYPSASANVLALGGTDVRIKMEVPDDVEIKDVETREKMPNAPRYYEFEFQVPGVCNHTHMYREKCYARSQRGYWLTVIRMIWCCSFAASKPHFAFWSHGTSTIRADISKHGMISKSLQKKRRSNVWSPSTSMVGGRSNHIQASGSILFHSLRIHTLTSRRRKSMNQCQPEKLISKALSIVTMSWSLRSASLLVTLCYILLHSVTVCYILIHSLFLFTVSLLVHCSCVFVVVR